MNINDLKNKKPILSLAEQAINRFEVFIEVCNKLNPLVVDAVEKKKSELCLEFEEYFQSNEFQVQKHEGSLVASFDDVKVILKDESQHPDDGEAYFSLQIPSEKVYSTIVIVAGDGTNGMICWRNILSGSNGSFIDFENYRKQIEEIKNEQALKMFIKQVNENIDWYNNTIEKFNQVKYIYKPYKGYEEYKTFEEYFKAL